MTDYRQPLVAPFMTKCKQWDGKTILSSPKPKDDAELATYKLRLKLSIEETFELFEAVLTKEEYLSKFQPLLDQIDINIDAIASEDMEVKPVDVFDSLVDQDYVNIGFANILGLDMSAGFNEVQRSNMTKLDANGEAILRYDGKLLKSDLYVAPDLVTVYNNTKFTQTN